MNRKLLASAAIAGALSAPVAIAVADENDTNTTNNQTTASQSQDGPVVDPRIKTARAERRAEIREKKAERKARKARKAKARKRARQRAQLAKQAAAPAQSQVAAAPSQGSTGSGTATPGNLSGIASCESGGNPSAVSPDGQYRGKYQFDQQTWASVGGSGDPAAAPEAEQDQRAAMLYARAGSSPWPNCG